MTHYRPIAKGERIDSYAKNLAQHAFKGDLRRTGELVIGAHLKPVADLVREVVLPPYRQAGVAISWLHDIVEDHGDQFEVVYPPHDNFENRTSKKTYLNDLLKAAGKRGQRVSFGVNLLTRRPGEDYSTYFQRVFSEDRTPLTYVDYVLGGINKLADNGVNGGEKDVPKVDVFKLWNLYLGFSRMVEQGGPQLLETIPPFSFMEGEVPQPFKEFIEYMDQLGLFQALVWNKGEEYKLVPSSIKKLWGKQVNGPDFNIKEANDSGTYIGNQFFSELLGSIYHAHKGKRFIRGVENLLIYSKIAERSLLANAPPNQGVFDKKSLEFLFEKFHDVSHDMIRGVNDEWVNNPHLATSGLNRGLRFPKGYTPLHFGGSEIDGYSYGRQLIGEILSVQK